MNIRWSLFLGSPLYLHNDVAWDVLFLVFAGLEIEILIYSPLLGLFEYFFKVNGGLSKVIFFIEVPSFWNSEAKFEIRSWKDLVLEHLELDNDRKFRKFEVGHFDGFLLVYDKLDEYFCWAVLWQL